MYKKCEEILKELENENKIKVWWDFKFPEKEELKLRLKDMLEDEVDEKYYINDGILNSIKSENQAGYLSGGKWDKINESCRRYYKEEGLSPSIHTCQGGNTEPKVVIRTPLKSLNRNQKNIEGDYAFCVDSCNTEGIKEITNESIKVRKLTPLECWRLMGFTDNDFYKAKNTGNSNSQLYKQAGNSIVVNVLEKIFKNLLKEEK